MNSRLKLRHFEAFVAVCEEHHVGRAAERLRLTQPAISKTLADLDDIVGTRLVDRSRRGVSLTRRGEEFLPHAIQAIAAVERAAHIASTGLSHLQAETVRVGALPTVAPGLLPRALERFVEQHPHSTIRLLTAANDTLVRWLTTGVVDLALGRMSDPSEMSGLTFEWLYVEPLVVVVRPGHPLQDERGPGLDRLLSFPVVASLPGTLPRHNLDSYLASRGARLPNRCLETLSVTVARLVVQGSDAVWFAPAGAVDEDVRSSVLARLPVQMNGTEEPVGLLRRREGQCSPATEDLAAVLRSGVSERPIA